MDKLIENQISTFLKSQSRNKVVFYKDYNFDFIPINIGFLLSQSIYNWNDNSKLSMKVTSDMDSILEAGIINHNIFGKVVVISNIGILLEPVLKQNIASIFEKHSKNNTLFVKWDGEIEDGYLYFLSKEKGIKIKINELSHIAI